MSDPVFRSDMGVQLISCDASDHYVTRAARVSTVGYDADAQDFTRKQGLIRYLMNNRHGTPFEHNSFQFHIECPIFVAREFMRHRIGWSYNEESGRYKQLDPVFWVPAPARPLVQEGKPGAYIMKPGTKEQYGRTINHLTTSARADHQHYREMLEDGIAREVARGCLPVSIFTSFFATCNARSLMSFLSLRVDSPDAMFQSKPQYEIEQVARQMEDFFHKKMPTTYNAFLEAKRVAP